MFQNPGLPKNTSTKPFTDTFFCKDVVDLDGTFLQMDELHKYPEKLPQLTQLGHELITMYLPTCAPIILIGGYTPKKTQEVLKALVNQYYTDNPPKITITEKTVRFNGCKVDMRNANDKEVYKVQSYMKHHNYSEEEYKDLPTIRKYFKRNPSFSKGHKIT